MRATLAIYWWYCGATIVGLVFTFAGGTERPDSCYDTASTQFELNQCAGKLLKEAEAELRQVTDQIRSEKAGEREFLEQFEIAQKAWLAFRDAELKAIFPLDRQQYGSVFPMCYAQWKTELTRERAKQLRRWLQGTEEGDVCSGSLPVRRSK